VIEELAGNHRISAFLSAAGERVVRVYGLMPKLKKICSGGHYRELVRETVNGSDSPFSGRFFRKAYDLLIVSPASANTVAKVTSGISDSLVTNVIAQAEKGEVPIVIVPTDQERRVRTRLPYLIDRSICEGCDECTVIDSCPAGAILMSGEFPRIDLWRCDGCGACLKGCPLGAITFGKEITFTARDVDLQNVEKLRMNRNFTVLARPKEILGTAEKILGGKSG
jgi:dihydromethanopterin reductase (acceptor)